MLAPYLPSINSMLGREMKYVDNYNASEGFFAYQQHPGNPAMKLIDARTQAEIDGKDLRGIKRGGFIESSIPVYWEDTFDATTKAFKPASEIARLYRDKGISDNDRVTVYCQVGMRASHDLFTLALIGHDLSKLANYYGAWEEWGNRDDTPVKIKQ